MQAAVQMAAQSQAKSTPKSERRFSNPVTSQGLLRKAQGNALKKQTLVEAPRRPNNEGNGPRIQTTKVQQNKPRRNGSFGTVGQVPSNLEKSRRVSGSTPNLSQAQMSERYQPGFNTTPAERAEQLRKARGTRFHITSANSILEQIEQDKMKRTESLKQRISMFEAARQKSNAPPERTTEAPASLGLN